MSCWPSFFDNVSCYQNFFHGRCTLRHLYHRLRGQVPFLAGVATNTCNLDPLQGSVRTEVTTNSVNLDLGQERFQTEVTTNSGNLDLRFNIVWRPSVQRPSGDIHTSFLNNFCRENSAEPKFMISTLWKSARPSFFDRPAMHHRL